MQNNSNPNNNDSNAIVKFSNPAAPSKNQLLRKTDMVVNLTTNLMKLEISKSEQKLCIYSVSIVPELAKDNYSLYSKIQRQIDNELNKYFTRKCFSGNNLFASSNDPQALINCNAIVENIEYVVTFKKVSQMEISEITDFEGENQRKKSFLEKVIKDILLKNKNTVKFGDDRTIVKIQETNVMYADPNKEDKETIYKGFYTSAQITESGLFLLVLNVNKHVSNITVLEKINNIRNEHKGLPESEIRKVIEEYFITHKTVLTTYGSLRTYRIKSIDFDTNPRKTSFNVKDGDRIKTISIEEYYKIQYKVTLKNPDQPLLIAERKTKGKKVSKIADDKSGKEKTDANNANINQNNTEEPIIFLVPELLYTTGTNTETDSKDKRRNIISKTKVDPNKKMEEISKINELMNNNNAPKSYKGKDGKSYPSKTSAEVSKEWGINLGENLTIKGRILPQPKLLYGKNQIVTPNNGNFRSGPTFNGVTLNSNNFVYVYDKRDNSDIRNSLKGLLDKGRSKGLNINSAPGDLHGVSLGNFSNWDDIRRSLNVIEQHANNLQMTVVFLSSHLEKYYSNLKDYFTNVIKIPTQFVVSKKLQDQRRAGSIMFNIVEQINIKMGGTNFYINFYDNILSKGKIYLILGLELRQVNGGEVDFVLTSSTTMNLNKMITTVRKCKNNREEKEKTINELMEMALKGLRQGGAPHPPNYIILYRQGGNYVQNKKIAENEVPMFINFINSKKETIENFKSVNPKFIYVCCNLKGDLKFFEKNNKNCMNPKSGLCVDSHVTQKDKYEFYIQPQYVNQGTATPCHYQVLYEDKDEQDPNNNLKIEQLQLLSFYLSFYYWTWAGAVRVPGALKLATTAMDFFSKHLNSKLLLPEQKFVNPSYI
jgi:aubergine-like protein